MTNCRMADMGSEEVISIKDDTRLGAVNDIEIKLKTTRVNTIIIYGQLRQLSLPGREDDTIIRQEDIQVVGEGTVLAGFSMPFRPKERFGSNRFHM